VSRLKWWRSQALQSQTRAGGGGLGSKNPKLSARTCFQAASAQLVLKWVAVWVQQPSWSNLRGGGGLG
jgi:hypothetical protein